VEEQEHAARDERGVLVWRGRKVMLKEDRISKNGKSLSGMLTMELP
jgi:hypothetical protein